MSSPPPRRPLAAGTSMLARSLSRPRIARSFPALLAKWLRPEWSSVCEGAGQNLKWDTYPIEKFSQPARSLCRTAARCRGQLCASRSGRPAPRYHSWALICSLCHHWWVAMVMQQRSYFHVANASGALPPSPPPWGWFYP